MRSFVRAVAPFALAGLLVTPAFAAPGLRLSWDHCFADGQVVNKAFACGTNLGSEVLDLSFESPVAASDRDGVELTLHLVSSDGTLPDWWRASGVGACRSVALASAIIDPNSIDCDQPIPTLNGAGGIADLVQFTPTVWRLRAAVAVPPPSTFSVGPGTETFAMQLIVRNIRTVGTGSCAGCTTPICIGFGSANVVAAANTDPIFIVAGAPNTGGGPANVTWQGAYTSGYSFPGAASSVDFGCAPSKPVAVRGSTWGALKAMYH